MRRKINENRNLYIEYCFRISWHKCEICGDEFKWTQRTKDTVYVPMVGLSGVNRYYFCNKHSRADVEKWIATMDEKIPSLQKSENILKGYNPPPENEKLPEKPTPKPPPKIDISHMVGE